MIKEENSINTCNKTFFFFSVTIFLQSASQKNGNNYNQENPKISQHKCRNLIFEYEKITRDVFEKLFKIETSDI